MFRRNCMLASILLLAAVPAGGLDGQQEGNAMPEAVPVNVVIENTLAAIDELMDTAFDRLDRSLMLAGMEARATVNQVSVQTADLAHLAIGELDGQQRRLISDLLTLEGSITQNLGSHIEALDATVRETLAGIQILLSTNPGYVVVLPGFAIEGSEYIKIRIRGAALSRLRFTEFRVNGRSADPTIIHQDDIEITMHLPLDEPASIGITGPVEVPISFSVKESFLSRPFAKKRVFSSTGYVLPRIVGTAKAVFVGDVLSEDRREVSHGPYRSKRVKSNLFGRPGRTTQRISLTPDVGWLADFESAKIDFRLLTNECSNSRSYARWIGKTQHVLHVEVHTQTQRNPLVTCRSETTITFNQWRSQTARYSIETQPQDISHGNVTVFRLEDEAARRLRNARLSHVLVESHVGRIGTLLLRAGESLGGLRIDYDSSTQTVYVHSEFVGGTG